MFGRPSVVGSTPQKGLCVNGAINSFAVTLKGQLICEVHTKSWEIRIWVAKIQLLVTAKQSGKKEGDM